ncbi:MAG: pilus assembly protein [Acidobacteriia bacterium]|nr:pilus assembly protein [Terriglobia bacterium]
MRFWQEIRHETRGSQIAEAAVILPLVFAMLLGIAWFGRAFNLYATINRAAQEAAKAAAAPTCATCLPPNSFYDQATLKATVIDPILTAAHLDSSQVQGYTLQTGVQLNPGQTPPEFGTIVTLSYPYGFRLNGLSCCPLAIVPINTGVTITAQAQAREED